MSKENSKCEVVDVQGFGFSNSQPYKYCRTHKTEPHDCPKPDKRVQLSTVAKAVADLEELFRGRHSAPVLAPRPGIKQPDAVPVVPQPIAVEDAPADFHIGHLVCAKPGTVAERVFGAAGLAGRVSGVYVSTCQVEIFGVTYTLNKSDLVKL